MGEVVGRGPVDPTGGELTLEEFRALVRMLAETVGDKVSARAGAEGSSSRQVSEGEKVDSVTTIHGELIAVNRRRLARGERLLSDSTRNAAVQAVMAHVYGLSELDELWSHPEVEEIDANGPEQVWVTFAGGEKVRWSSIADSDDEMIDLIRRACRRLSLNEVEFDARHPQLDLQLPDGSRLFAVFGGAQGNGVAKTPCLALRRHRHRTPSRDDLVAWGVLPAAAMDFVIAAVRGGENLVVAGDHNSGKTTFLRAVFLEAVAPHERVVTIEAQLTELGLDAVLPNVATLYSRGPSAEGDGEVTVSDLVRRASRRLNPTRVVVGEILGDEVGPVLDVFSGSTRGSGCTIHARSARGTPRRFEQYGLAAHPPVPPDAVHYALAEAAPLIVHLTCDESQPGRLRRYCTSIVEVTGELEGGRVATTELWGGGPGGLEPRHGVSSARRARMEQQGWSWQLHGWLPASNGRLP